MRKFNKFGQLIALGSAGAIGWIVAQIQFQSDGNARKVPKPPKFPGLPLYGTVSASSLGNVLSLPDTPEFHVRPAPNASRISQIMHFGFPSLTNIRSMDDFVISYDTRNRVPNWVFEHLTSESVAKNTDVSRENCDFYEDLSVHSYFRSQNSDYKRSGYDRGHMAAAGNHKANQKYCQETFVLSNIAPQVGKGFNRDKWNDLESYCRKLTKVYRDVYVCTGPLYLPRLEDDGKTYVKYEVIGHNHVAVPTHYYKIIVCVTNNADLDMEAYILPNAPIENSVSLDTFLVNPEVIERASGLLFFDRINRKKISKINGKKPGWF